MQQDILRSPDYCAQGQHTTAPHKIWQHQNSTWDRSLWPESQAHQLTRYTKWRHDTTPCLHVTNLTTLHLKKKKILIYFFKLHLQKLEVTVGGRQGNYSQANGRTAQSWFNTNTAVQFKAWQTDKWPASQLAVLFQIWPFLLSNTFSLFCISPASPPVPITAWTEHTEWASTLRQLGWLSMTSQNTWQLDRGCLTWNRYRTYSSLSLDRLHETSHTKPQPSALPQVLMLAKGSRY